MRRLILLGAVIVGTGVVATTGPWRPDATATPTDVASADLSPADRSEMPEPVETLPPEAYDPVVKVPVGADRSLPPTNVVVNDFSGEPFNSTQSETAVFAKGDLVVVGWNDGRGFQGVGNNSGYAYSTDRGATFVDGGSPPEGPSADILGDPAIISINDGTWLYASLDLGTPNAIAINRGTFVGGVLEWEPSIKVTSADAFLDKEWLGYDDVTDRVYLTWTRGGDVELVYSDDGGVTWSTPNLVVNGTNASGSFPVAGIDGQMYVAWIDPLGSGTATALIRRSDDGGDTWATGPRQINSLGFQSGDPPLCFNRDFNARFAQVGVDRSDGPFRGRVYAAYTNGAPGDFDVFVKRSENDGVSWTGQIRLNDNENFAETESFWPSLEVGPEGRITVGWYDRRNMSGGNSLTDFYVTQSVDGGITWGPNRRVSDMSVNWCGVPADVSPNFGDYVDIYTDDRSVFCTWSDGREGNPDVIFARVDDVHTLTASGDAGSPEPIAGDGTAWFIPNEAEVTVAPVPADGVYPTFAWQGIVMGLLATPAETPGIFDIGGEDLSGTLTLTGDDGIVTGSFDLARVDEDDLAVTFDTEADPALAGILEDTWSATLTLSTGGVGAAGITGTVTMSDGVDDVVFDVSGAILFDGDPGGVLTASQELEHTASVSGLVDDYTLHTRTLVEDGVIIAVNEPATPTNPYPEFRVKASPNPLRANTVVRYDLDVATEGRIRVYDTSGRVVRDLYAGPFEIGRHEIPFDGRDDAGRDLSSGAYFVKMETTLGTVNAKLFVVR